MKLSRKQFSKQIFVLMAMFFYFSQIYFYLFLLDIDDCLDAKRGKWKKYSKRSFSKCSLPLFFLKTKKEKKRTGKGEGKV